MHIAIYSYKVGERKQMERLMEREADRWIKSGKPIYAYTFGSIESLMASTLVYDAVMIDLCDNDKIDAGELIGIYRDKNVKTRVIECAFERERDDDEFSYFFLQKDIKTADLHELMVKLDATLHKDSSKIELRSEDSTIYVEETDIMYALQNHHLMEVYLADGRIISTFGRVEMFYAENEKEYPTIILPAPETLVNIRYIKSTGLLKVFMKDGRKIHIRSGMSPYIKEVLEVLKTGDEEALKKLTEE